MAVQTVDSSNQVAVALGAAGRIDSSVPKEKNPIPANLTEAADDPKVETKAEQTEAPADDIDDGLSTEERAELKEAAGDRTEKVRRQVARKHAAMKAAQEKAEELAGRMADAEAFAESQYRERMLADRQVEELRAQLKIAPKSESTTTEAEIIAPKLEDFKDANEFAKALAEYTKALTERAIKADRAERERERQEREAAQTAAALLERKREFAKEHPDYEATVAALGDQDLRVPDYLAQYLTQEPTGVALMYHFAKNLADLQRITQLSPIKAIAALGKLEAALEAPKETKTEAKAEVKEPKVEPKAEASKAPPPIAALNGSSAAVPKDLRDMTTRETIEYWAARDKAAATRRKRH